VIADPLLSSALVYLAAATVCVPIAHKFRLGSVLGYLGAGAAIGPFGLRLATDAQATLHLAEFGVVLMLFAIGLELDPKRLWSMRRPVFVGGGLQLLVSAVPIGVGAYLLGMRWQAALVLGFALSLSSTAVAMQTMNEKGMASAPVGRTAFAILLFQDIAAIPLLALVPLLAASAREAGGSGWLSAGKALLAILLVVVIGRYLTRPVLRRLARTGVREVFTAFALLLVFGIALLMSSVGVSMALGAFLAGVLLASSEYRHALESDIAPFRGLLMGLFFIAVGMSIDFGLLAQRPLTVLGLLLGYQAIKVLGLRALGRALGVAPPQRWLIAGLLAQGGEFAFVVFGVAREAKVLPGDGEALLTLTVALSMMLTPVLLALDAKFFGRRRASAEPDLSADFEEAPVIVAGFGRFGQIVARLLLASDIKPIVLDFDPDQVETLRSFGFEVHFGDATRLDLLQAAHADRARLLIVAIDDVEASLRLVDAVRENFPRLALVARARNVGHYAALRQRGVTVVERETFEGAVALGRAALVALGVRPFEARERADVFRRHNIQSLEEILPHWESQEKRRAMARSARAQLEEQMRRDFASRGQEGAQEGVSWDEKGD
jgi:glutathione-regulated potassium-efflux system ancillary protein KefC